MVAETEAETLKYSKAEGKKHLNVNLDYRLHGDSLGSTCAALEMNSTLLSGSHLLYIKIPLLPEHVSCLPCVSLTEHGVHVSSGSPVVDTNDIPPWPDSRLNSKLCRRLCSQAVPKGWQNVPVFVFVLYFNTLCTYLRFLEKTWRSDTTSKQGTVQKSYILSGLGVRPRSTTQNGAKPLV